MVSTSATVPARRPSAGAVPGRWGACLALRTPPAASVTLWSLFSPRTYALSRDEVQILRQRPGNRRFEVARQLRVDQYGAVRGEEGRDQVLYAEGDLSNERHGALDL